VCRSSSADQFRQIVDPGLATQPPQTDESGWYGEETLDIEAVHGMAPGAKIVFLGALNSQDATLDMVMNNVIDHRLARIVSNSYGELGEQLPPELIKAENSIYLQAALEGIGIYFSSGDNGDEVDTLGYRTVDWPASSPWVTAVGGTSLGVGACNQYLFETGWGTGHSVLGDGVWTPDPPGDWWYGGGGGTSVLYRQPWYQHRVVPASIADYFDTGTNWRAVPDVAMDGDPTTGMLVGETQTFSDGVYYDTYRIGGTSLSCPCLPASWRSPTSGHAARTGSPTRRCIASPEATPIATSSIRKQRSRRCAATSSMARMTLAA